MTLDDIKHQLEVAGQTPLYVRGNAVIWSAEDGEWVITLPEYEGKQRVRIELMSELIEASNSPRYRVERETLALAVRAMGSKVTTDAGVLADIGRTAAVLGIMLDDQAASKPA